MSSKEVLLGFVDYENFRMAFRNYTEFITVEQIIAAFEALGRELGDLRTLFFYGDWTRRPQDARTVEEHGHRAMNVLSTRFGKDRSDFSMGFDMYDHAKEDKEVSAFIVGSGDAGFKEAILRCRQHGKRIYVLCFGKSAARELFTLTNGVYPLEARLGLTEKAPIQPAMPGAPVKEENTLVRCLIEIVDSVEKSIPYIVRNYLRDKVLLPKRLFGETIQEIDGLLDDAIQEGILLSDEIANPKIEGRMVQIIRLDRSNGIVREALPSN